MSIRRKRKHEVKRNRTGVRTHRPPLAFSNANTSISNSMTDSNRSSLPSSTHPSLLPPNNSTGASNTTLPTATRNPSSGPTATKKAASSTLTGLLTASTPSGFPAAGALPGYNGTGQYPNAQSSQYGVSETKPPQATKNNVPMAGISAGLAGRGPSKASRASGGAGTGPKR